MYFFTKKKSFLTQISKRSTPTDLHHPDLHLAHFFSLESLKIFSAYAKTSLGLKMEKFLQTIRWFNQDVIKSIRYRDGKHWTIGSFHMTSAKSDVETPLRVQSGGGGYLVQKTIRGCAANMGSKISLLVYEWPLIKCKIWYMNGLIFQKFP